jgi:hypothetical protein
VIRVRDGWTDRASFNEVGPLALARYRQTRFGTGFDEESAA